MLKQHGILGSFSINIFLFHTYRLLRHAIVAMSAISLEAFYRLYCGAPLISVGKIIMRFQDMSRIGIFSLDRLMLACCSWRRLTCLFDP